MVPWRKEFTHLTGAPIFVTINQKDISRPSDLEASRVYNCDRTGQYIFEYLKDKSEGLASNQPETRS